MAINSAKMLIYGLFLSFQGLCKARFAIQEKAKKTVELIKA